MSKDNGLSKPAFELARKIDSLQPGEYTIALAKTKWPVGIVAKIERNPELTEVVNEPDPDTRPN